MRKEWLEGDVSMRLKTHKDLEVWKKSMVLAEVIYEITKKFPKDELYGLVSQMRRAAVSVPSNIAEGAARSTKKEFIHFLYIARGSLSELETQMILANKFGYIKSMEGLPDLIVEIRKMILGLIRYHMEKK